MSEGQLPTSTISIKDTYRYTSDGMNPFKYNWFYGIWETFFAPIQKTPIWDHADARTLKNWKKQQCEESSIVIS